jgi:hypothetical protein
LTVKKQDYIVGRMNVGYAAAEADAPSPVSRSGPAPVLPIGVYYCGPFVFLKSLG